jgi:hypothetical protein
MSRRLRVKVDPRAASMTAAIRTAARSAPLFVLIGRALADLAAELGSVDLAARSLPRYVLIDPEREPESWASHWRRFTERRP